MKFFEIKRNKPETVKPQGKNFMDIPLVMGYITYFTVAIILSSFLIDPIFSLASWILYGKWTMSAEQLLTAIIASIIMFSVASIVFILLKRYKGEESMRKK